MPNPSGGILLVGARAFRKIRKAQPPEIFNVSGGCSAQATCERTARCLLANLKKFERVIRSSFIKLLSAFVKLFSSLLRNICARESPSKIGQIKIEPMLDRRRVSLGRQSRWRQDPSADWIPRSSR